MSKPKHVNGPAVAAALAAPSIVEVAAGQFKDRCLELLDRVNEGTIELVVTKHGRPVARVVSIASEAPSAFGFMHGTVLDQDDLVSPDFEAWSESE